MTVTLLMSSSPVFAQGYGLKNLIGQETRLENQATKAAQKQETNLTNLKQRADKAIDNRIAELGKLSSRIQNDSRLSADEKSSLTAEIQTNITGLTNLKTKIDADTDIAVARTDAKSIYSFRIYMVVVPQTRLLITIDNLATLTTNLQGLTPKVQDLINTLKSQGKDVSNLQSLLDDINKQLSTISTKLATDKQTVMAVTPQTANPGATFASVRQDLASVRQDFATIRHDVGQMRVDFKGQFQVNAGNPKTTPTLTPTPTP